MRATFSRPIDPGTLTGASFSLRRADGSLVPAAVSYDDASSTAVLTPAAALAYAETYTAQISASVRARDGMPLSSAVQWSFSVLVPVPPQVTLTVPVNGATDYGPGVRPRAEFSKRLIASSVNQSTYTLTGPAGQVSGVVSYDAAAQAATFTPSAPLPAGAYTATLAASITAEDEAVLGTPFSWTFTVVGTSPPLTTTSLSPADAAVGVPRNAPVTARFSRALDPTTVTGTSFSLRRADGTTVAAGVTYEPTSNTAILTPSQPLTGGVSYTARLESSIQAADGTGLAAPVQWTFTASACPCSLFSVALVPAQTNLGVQDGRVGPGPWSYELGVKVKVDQPMAISAVRFYKASQETGVHIGRVWTASGVELAADDLHRRNSLRLAAPGATGSAHAAAGDRLRRLGERRMPSGV